MVAQAVMKISRWIGEIGEVGLGLLRLLGIVDCIWSWGDMDAALVAGEDWFLGFLDVWCELFMGGYMCGGVCVCGNQHSIFIVRFESCKQ